MANVTSVKNIFHNCINLNNVSLKNINYTNLKSADKMFYNCMNLTSGNFSN